MSTATLSPNRSDTINRVPDVAARLDVSTDAVYRLIREGRLRAIRVGRLIRVPESALAAFIDGDGEAAQ